jgi:membrane protease YdiL (CAAX protease family)
LRVITKPIKTSSFTGNPYRKLLRQDYPEPLIALLAFVLGIWLWDHYFGKVQGYAPGTEEIALVKIDRDLRLADAMEEDPEWLRWLAGAERPEKAREEALEVFQNLAKEKAISPRGLEAFAIVKSVHTGLSMRELVGQFLQGSMISDFQEISDRLARHEGTWWNARLIEVWEENAQPATLWRQSHGEDALVLKTRAVVARSLVWLLALVGLAFIPASLRCLKGGLSAKRTGYGSAWPLSLGVMVFFVATLAWIGFSSTLDLGLGLLPSLHPFFAILLDSIARVLPMLIALSILFKRPSHAIRVLGMNQKFHPKLILGTFSLLMLFDQVFRWAMASSVTGDPGGGLSMGDTGWWGLAFALISACLLAPLAEEVLYRGVLFRSLWNQIGVIPGALISSAVFAILHFYDAYGLLSVGFFGFTCALLYAGSGSLATVVLLHMLYNSSIKIPEWIVYHAPFG